MLNLKELFCCTQIFLRDEPLLMKLTRGWRQDGGFPIITMYVTFVVCTWCKQHV